MLNKKMSSAAKIVFSDLRHIQCSQIFVQILDDFHSPHSCRHLFCDIFLPVFMLFVLLFLALLAGCIFSVTKIVECGQLILAFTIKLISPLVGRLLSDPPEHIRYVNCFKAHQLQVYTPELAGAAVAVRQDLGHAKALDVDRKRWHVTHLSDGATFFLIDGGGMFYCTAAARESKKAMSEASSGYTELSNTFGKVSTDVMQL